MAAWADVDVALVVEDEVGSTECAIGACRLIPDRDVRGDVAVHQPLKHPDRTIGGVAHKPLWSKLEASPNTLQHGLGDSYLRNAIGARTFGVDDDPGFVVDQVAS